MLALRIALRYLFAKKHHAAVNVISIISVAGVAVATAAIVVVLSVFNGFADLGAARMSVVDPQLQATPLKGKTIASADSVAEALTALPEVALAVPVVEERALLVTSQGQVPVRMMGVTRDYAEVVELDSLTTDGTYFIGTAMGRPTANLSIGTAYHAGITPSADRQIELYVPRRQGRINPANPMSAFRGDTLLVWSILRSDVQDFDTDRIVMPIAAARQLLDYSTEATALHIRLKPGVDEAGAQERLRQLLPQCRVENRLEMQADSFRMIAVEKWMTFMMLSFILLIAAFNVVSTLSLLIVEKQPDMYTYRALGASRSLRRNIFVWQGSLITLVGGAAGIVLGTALTLLQQYCHLIRLNAEASAVTIQYYPVRLNPLDLPAVLLVIAGVAVLAGQTTRLLNRQKD